MRALPGMVILSPADAQEAYKMAFAVMDIDRPVYIRLSGGMESPIIYKQNKDFILGKADKLTEGTDVAIVTTGLMVSESLRAAELLEAEGVFVSVYNFSTISPLDTEALDEIFRKCKLVVTVEEHSSKGGLGGAVAEYRTGFVNMPPQIILGLPDYFPKSGQPAFMWNEAGISSDKIAGRVEAALRVLER